MFVVRVRDRLDFFLELITIHVRGFWLRKHGLVGLVGLVVMNDEENSSFKSCFRRTTFET